MPGFDDAKGLLTSKTFWGVILMVVSLFAKPIAEAVNADALSAMFEAVFAAVGAVLAVWGRIKAAKSIRGIV